MVWIKIRFSEVAENNVWQIGTGDSINFWTDPWLSDTLDSVLNIPSHVHVHLKANVRDFISDGNWCIPSSLLVKFPAIEDVFQKISIRVVPSEDAVRWKLTESG